MTSIEERSATRADYQTSIQVKASPDALFDALTTATRACPESAAAALYVSPVAPEIGTQLAPAASHCSH